MSEITKSMLDHPFFKDSEVAHVDFLGDCASSVYFPARTHMFREGERAGRLYLIQRGKIAIELPMPGRDPLSIMTVDAGGVVGWSWLFPPYRWNFSARIVEDTSAVALDTNCLLLKCREDYRIGYELMWRCANVVGERLEATRAQLLSAMS